MLQTMNRRNFGLSASVFGIFLSGCLSTATPTVDKGTGLSPIPTEESHLILSPSATGIPTATALPLPTSDIGPTMTAIPVSESVFQLVAQMGGAFRAIAVSGDSAFVGQGPRIVALDIRNPHAIQEISRTDMLPATISHVVVGDSVLYAAAGNHLTLVGVSDPSHMVVEPGSIDLPGDVSALILREKTVYVTGQVAFDYSPERNSASFLSYVAAINVSGDAPQLVDMLEVPHAVDALALAGDYLYLASYRFEEAPAPFLAIDARDPAHLSQPQTIANMPPVFDMQVFQTTLLIASEMDTLDAYDVTNPLSPEPAWNLTDGSMGAVEGLVADRDHIYTIGAQPAGARIPTRSQLTAPEPLAASDYAVSSSLAVHNAIVYIVEKGLFAYPIDQPIDPIGRYDPRIIDDLAASPEAIYSLDHGGLALSGWDPAKLTAYSIPDLGILADYTATSADNTQNLLYGITIDARFIYLTGQNQLEVLDQTDLSPVNTIRSEVYPGYELYERDAEVPVSGHFAYLPFFEQSNPAMVVRLDLADPRQPQVASQIQFDSPVIMVDAAATSSWLALLVSNMQRNSVELLVYQLSSGTPQQIGKLQVPADTMEVQIGDQWLALGRSDPYGRSGITTDLTVVSLPNLNVLSRVAVPGVHEIVLRDQLALVTMKEDNRLFAFDLKDPVNPRTVGAFALGSTSGELAVSGDYVIVGNHSMGIYILSINMLPED